MKGLTKGKDPADFVGLEMADEVPAELWRKQRDFLKAFLNPALAKKPLTGLASGLQAFRGKSFADSQQFHSCARAPGSLGSGSNTIPDFVEAFS